MTNYHQGKYTVTNTQKYIGPNVNNVRFRSSWEFSCFTFLDKTESILGWSSESISIPYRNPLNGKNSMYIPDLLVIYMDKTGQKHCEIMEIKPMKECPGYNQKVDKKTQLVQVINAAKWQAAILYCAKRGWKFRVITEDQLFAFKRKS